jgi:hypothetical protein
MDATSIIRIALSVLAGRLLVFLALGMVCGMTSWAMWGPQWERLAALSIFSLFTFLVLRKDRSLNDEKVSNE